MKLSICISTRNRLQYLIQALDSIIPQLVNGVEIVIVDGASSDGTQEYFTKSFHHQAIRYFRRNVNGGLDRDFDNSVVFATGEYCWLFSDDDKLLSGAVERVLRAVETAPSMVFINTSSYDNSFEVLLNEHEVEPISKSTFAPSETDLLFSLLGRAISYIGVAVFRRSIWLEREREKYVGTFFIHVGVWFQEALPFEAIFIPQPCIGKRAGIRSWTSSAFVIWNFHFPRIVWSLRTIGDSAKASVVSKTPWNSSIQLLKFRVLGAYSIVEFNDYIAKLDIPIFRKLLFRAIALIPGSMLNSLALLFAMVVIRDKPEVILEIKNSRYSLFSANYKSPKFFNLVL